MLDSIGRQEKWLLLESKFFNAVAKNFMCSWIDISYSFIWVTCDSKYRVNIVIPKNIPAAKCGPNTGRGFLWDGLKSSREAWLTWDHMHKVWRCCKKWSEMSTRKSRPEFRYTLPGPCSHFRKKYFLGISIWFNSSLWISTWKSFGSNSQINSA